MAAARTPRSTSSPPTTASRCATSSYNQKHNEANGENNRDGDHDNSSWNCGAEGPTDDRRSCAAGRASSATCWRRCCSPRACRCCWAATSSAAPRAATITPTARTTRSRWIDWEDRRRASLLAFTRAADRAAPRASRVPPPRGSSSGPRRSGSEPPGRRRGSGPTATPMTDGDWHAGAHVRRHVPQRRGDHTPRRAAAERRRRRLVPAAVQRPPRGRRVHAAGAGASARQWTLELPTRTSRVGDGARGGRSRPGARSTVERALAGSVTAPEPH